MRPIDELFVKLSGSLFRARFHLSARDKAYIGAKGMDVVLRHGRDFIGQKLAPANPKNDGKQTPMRGHPVFIAQHATATCCRGCLEKWHGIERGKALSEAEQAHVLAVIERWLRAEAPDTKSKQGSLL